MTTLPLIKSIVRSPSRLALLLIPFVFACFAVSPVVQAVAPPPDGGYPGQNTAEGNNALLSLTSGDYNTAIGFQALFNLTTGRLNTATGVNALQNNTTGQENTANGAFALAFATSWGNTATGAYALYRSTGGYNTATGDQALGSNTTGFSNTATGASAMAYTTQTGSCNTATGREALYRNATGSFNTATGFEALSGTGTTNFNTGTNNTATGFQALNANTTGNNNTADGTKALFHNTTGSNNTANGINAMFLNSTGNSNIAEGNGALGNSRTGSFNTAVGFNAGANLTTGSDNIDIGALGVAGESSTTRIGTVRQTSTFITGISGAVVTGAPVVVNAAGQLGVAPSSERFKNHIESMDTISEAILALKPVSFCYEQDIDPEGLTQFGLVAEDVAKVNPNLVVHDNNGEIYTVRYEAVNAMLLNEFLKEHRKVEQQERTNAELKSGMTALAATVKEQAAQIQKVSTQLEASKSAPRVVNNNQ